MGDVIKFPSRLRDISDQEYVDRVFTKLAFYVAEQTASCLRRKVGAVLLSTVIGPYGLPHVICGHSGAFEDLCRYIGCSREGVPSGVKLDICRGIHAEQRVLAKTPTDLTRGAILYITDSPCSTCAKLAILKQVERVVYSRQYPDTVGLELLGLYGVDYKQVKEEDLHGISLDLK